MHICSSGAVHCVQYAVGPTALASPCNRLLGERKCQLKSSSVWVNSDPCSKAVRQYSLPCSTCCLAKSEFPKPYTTPFLASVLLLSIMMLTCGAVLEHAACNMTRQTHWLWGTKFVSTSSCYDSHVVYYWFSGARGRVLEEIRCSVERAY